jgi:tetratricopeptide (TPR) repeat protein
LLAYATRRADSLEAARAILLAAAEAHPSHAIIRYNLACYECQLGNISAAKEHLSEAFSLKPSCRETALTDPDLQPLLDGMGSF